MTCEERGLGVGRGPICQFPYSEQKKEKCKERTMGRNSQLEL